MVIWQPNILVPYRIDLEEEIQKSRKPRKQVVKDMNDYSETELLPFEFDIDIIYDNIGDSWNEY